MKITPNFHLNGCCKEAIQCYQRAFGAIAVTMLCNSDANPQDYQADSDTLDFVYHAEIMIGGHRIMMTDDLSVFPPRGNTLSLTVTFDHREEVKKAFHILSEGCRIISPMQSTTYSSCFVSLIDRFGVRWELMTEHPDV